MANRRNGLDCSSNLSALNLARHQQHKVATAACRSRVCHFCVYPVLQGSSSSTSSTSSTPNCRTLAEQKERKKNELGNAKHFIKVERLKSEPTNVQQPTAAASLAVRQS